MQDLTPIQVRVLGCLMEKKESTPDQYPLTLNSLRMACNQKTSRQPITAYTEGEVGHTIRELEALDLVREQWGARAPKYEHRVNKALNLHSKGIALTCVMMLRGPQTLSELRTHTHRLFEFDDLDDVQYAIQTLIDHEPTLAIAVPKQPGQKEGRFAQLLGGEPDIPLQSAPVTSAAASTGHQDRLSRLETELEELRNRLELIEATMLAENK
jgi:uncharacterized protein YceH (UPF0502 family)